MRYGDGWRSTTTGYQVNQEKPVPGFPNTITYARVLQERLRVQRQHQGKENYFFPNAGSLDVVKYIIERFVNDSRDMGMIPLCLLLYSSSDLRLIKAGIRFDDKNGRGNLLVAEALASGLMSMALLGH